MSINESIYGTSSEINVPSIVSQSYVAIFDLLNAKE